MKTLKSKLIAGVSALTLLLGSYFVSDAMAKEKEVKTPVVSTSLDWEFSPNVSADPLNPENYNPSSTSHCTGSSQVCGIKAPADAEGRPIIEENSPLAQRIQNKDTSQGDVFLMN